MEAVIDKRKVIAVTAVLMKPGQRKYTDSRVDIEERFRQFVEAAMELDPIPVLQRLEIGVRPSTDISEDVGSTLKSYSIATMYRDSVHYISRHAQPADNGEFWYQTFKANDNNRVYRPLDVPDLTVIRPVCKQLANTVDYHN